jgi:hypothetical protein
MLTGASFPDQTSPPETSSRQCCRPIALVAGSIAARYRKLSYRFPDLDIAPHPALLRSVKLSCRTREIDCLEYAASANRFRIFDFGLSEPAIGGRALGAWGARWRSSSSHARVRSVARLWRVRGLGVRTPRRCRGATFPGVCTAGYGMSPASGGTSEPVAAGSRDECQMRESVSTAGTPKAAPLPTLRPVDSAQNGSRRLSAQLFAPIARVVADVAEEPARHSRKNDLSLLPTAHGG